MDKIVLNGLEALNNAMALPKREDQDLLSRLNAEQKEAVCQGWGPSLIVAGAGSGKTTVLTRRIAYMINELHQDVDSIMAVTFTNKAAKEMKARVETIVGANKTRFAWIGTFHSICARLLRREVADYVTPEGWRWSNNFVIYDETDSLNILKGQIKALGLDDKMFAPREMKYTISAAKNDGYTYNLYANEAKSYRENKVAEIFHAYQKELARNNAFDFDDLILVFADIMRNRPDVRARLMGRFRHLLIDEFQDTNKAQYDFVRLLGDVTAEPHEIATGRSAQNMQSMSEQELASRWNERSLLVVGDVDQSIYSWRKADYRIFLGFQNDFPNCRVIKLEENYRSTSTILDIANSIIENNTERIDKVLRCNRGKGGKATFIDAEDEIDESYQVIDQMKRLKAQGRGYKDQVILYRTNAQSRAIEEILIRNGIPYTVVGGTKFYDRQEIKDIIAYLKLTYNPKDGQAFNRVINQPKRGIGKTSLERLGQYALERGLSSAEAAREASRISGISPKTAQAMQYFAHNLFTRWIPEATRQPQEDAVANGEFRPVTSTLGLILHDTKYLDMLQEEASVQKDELAYGRIENVQELLAVAKDFEDIADEPDLESFLTRIALVSDLDEADKNDDAVRLMTLHSAKGLEFPVVFLMGLEEGLFPHMRSFDTPTAMEEERRLMYVGVTRAEDLLFITKARKRSFRSAGGMSTNYTICSRFLEEITPGLLTGFYPQKAKEADDRSSFDDVYEDSYGGGYGSSDRSRNDRSGNSGGYGNSSGYGNSRSGGANESRYGRQNGFTAGNGGNSYGNRSGGSSSGNRSGGGGYGGNRSSGNTHPASNRPQAKPRVHRQGQAFEDVISSAPEVAYEELAVADKVQHTKFGIGTVLEISGEGKKRLYKINFDAVGEKWMDPNFAKLIKLS